MLGADALEAALEGLTFGLETEDRQARDDAGQPQVVVVAGAPPSRPANGEVGSGLDRDDGAGSARFETSASGSAGVAARRTRASSRGTASAGAKLGRAAEGVDRRVGEGRGAGHEGASRAEREEPLDEVVRRLERLGRERPHVVDRAAGAVAALAAIEPHDRASSSAARGHVRISTTSPSTTSCVLPTRCPSKRADGPHTRAPMKLAAEVVVDPVGDILDGRSGVERQRLLVDGPVVAQADPDEPGQRPDRVAEGLERPLVEDRHGDDLEGPGRRRRIRSVAPGSASSARVTARTARLLDPGGLHLREDGRRARPDRRPPGSSRRSRRPSGARRAAPGRRRGRRPRRR